KYFQYDDFRKLPDGRNLQKKIVSQGMADTPLLGILPTGFGKSICFQLPALVRFYRRGVLTVVISPLQSLMKDQVDNLKEATGTNAVAAIYGMLTPPERGEALEQVRLGDIGILYISPEQLRNRSVRKAISQREIGCWVFDESHCLSKWGHDFRPDYLYASRVIREFADAQKVDIPPVTCVTATAKPDVIADIVSHFQDQLGQDLVVFEGGIERANLYFEVQTVTAHEKNGRIHDLLDERIGNPPSGSAVIYCATRKSTEILADFLTRQGWQAGAFHGGLTAPEKRRIQELFISGDMPIICATNAFGMGIDKNNVRLVIHSDIPGSLENYLQEAGRAGRDLQDAHCVLLYDEDDIETQFRLGAMSELRQRDIAQILRGLKSAKADEQGEVVITTGELLSDDRVDTTFESSDYGADTRVKTAVSWLERAGFLERNENYTTVFQGRPRFNSLNEIRPELDKLNLSPINLQIWETILENLVNCDPDKGMSADELAEALGKVRGIQKKYVSDTRKIIQILNRMAEQGLLKSGIMLSAYLRPKGKNNAKRVLKKVCVIERAMLDAMLEEHPDVTKGEWVNLNLRKLNQRLLNNGHQDTNPEILKNLLAGLCRDGKGFAGRQASIQLRHDFQDNYRVKIQRDWPEILEIADRRRILASIILDALYYRIPKADHKAAEFLVEFSSNDLTDAINRNLAIHVDPDKMMAAIDRGLLFLHEQKAIILQKGLAVFRQAMTIRIRSDAGSRRYTKGDFEPLAQHYRQRTFQVHVMNEYARMGMEKIRQALVLITAYFTMNNKKFIKRFFPGRKKMIELATSEESFKRIVDSLKNPVQEAIVAGKMDDNSLILAGPGSGKTRVVIHRCAYLLRVERIPGKGILVLCFNHSTAVTLRKQLWGLVGSDAADVTILTYHGLAMRLTGRSFAAMNNSAKRDGPELGNTLDQVIIDAVDLLHGHKEITELDQDSVRDRLLSGCQYILVDEYQDIDENQYKLISALAGRSLNDPDRKLNILAVGDDDQSIYGFRNANVRFIRKFRQDYNAGIHHLVENYRSTRHIIEAANSLIEHNTERMKTKHSIGINRKRQGDHPGGAWGAIDPAIQGKVRRMTVKDAPEQAYALAQEIVRLKSLDPDIDINEIAVLARNGMNYPELALAGAALHEHSIPFCYALDRNALFRLSRVRELAAFIDELKKNSQEIKQASDLLTHFSETRANNENPWDMEIRRLLVAWEEESGNASVPVQYAIDFIYEALAEQRRDQRIGHGVFLSTAHGVKGMEFSHVFILDGAWRVNQDKPAMEEERRLYYMAMTRAGKTLTLFRRLDCQNPHVNLISSDHTIDQAISVPDKSKIDRSNLNYAVLGMKQLFLDFAGRQPEASKMHKALKRLNAGDMLSIKESNENIFLITSEGVPVARLSKQARDELQNKIRNVQNAKILAMVRRLATDV
ncbi:MAG: RecQ family ATP-dependent DNA helicase, partial [Thermodesulfobacteriota bacterium]|nr:RecQ family ATP-dependent DNA helicase [Thermodesulfobacteriota bacterium]